MRDEFPFLIVCYLMFQFICLKARGMTNVPTYLLIEFLQIYSLIPYLRYNYQPFMFDFFKALQLAFNFMLSNDVKLAYFKVFEEYADIYYNDQNKKFGISMGHLV